MKKCQRPEWSTELSDYCDCDSISSIDMDELWENVCTDCRWFFDLDDIMEISSHNG